MSSLPETGYASKALLEHISRQPTANPQPPARSPISEPEVRIGSNAVKECIDGQIAKLSITGESANAVASAAITLCNETIRRDVANYCAAKERACNPADIEKRVIEIIGSSGNRVGDWGDHSARKACG